MPNYRCHLLSFGVLYFGWPNLPSSGIMGLYIGRVFLFGMIVVFCVIPEISKANQIDNVK